MPVASRCSSTSRLLQDTHLIVGTVHAIADDFTLPILTTSSAFMLLISSTVAVAVLTAARATSSLSGWSCSHCQHQQDCRVLVEMRLVRW